MATKRSSKKAAPRSKFVARSSSKPRPKKSEKLRLIQVLVAPGTFKFERQSYNSPARFAEYSSAGYPCDLGKKGGVTERLSSTKCKVQLTFQKGATFLRVCTAARKPGRLIPVRGPIDARKKSNELCACMARVGKAKFEKECLGGESFALGRVPKKKRVKRGN